MPGILTKQPCNLGPIIPISFSIYQQGRLTTYNGLNERLPYTAPPTHTHTLSLSYFSPPPLPLFQITCLSVICLISLGALQPLDSRLHCTRYSDLHPAIKNPRTSQPITPLPLPIFSSYLLVASSSSSSASLPFSPLTDF